MGAGLPTRCTYRSAPRAVLRFLLPEILWGLHAPVRRVLVGLMARNSSVPSAVTGSGGPEDRIPLSTCSSTVPKWALRRVPGNRSMVVDLRKGYAPLQKMVSYGWTGTAPHRRCHSGSFRHGPAYPGRVRRARGDDRHFLSRCSFFDIDPFIRPRHCYLPSFRSRRDCT